MLFEIERLTSPYSTATENLALEESLLSGHRAAFFLHRDAPCVSVGLHQDLEAEVDVDLAEARGVQIVRRQTGGGAVYRDPGCVAASFVVPEAHDHLMVDVVVRALAVMGVAVERTGRNDLFLGDRKVSGFAWHKQAGMAIAHCSVLFSTDLELMTALLDRGKRKYRGTAIRSVRSRVRNLSDLFPEMDAAGFEEAFADALVRSLEEHGITVEGE